MMTARTMTILVATSAVLAGCGAHPARSAYDVFAEDFGPNGRTQCERFAYETGRQRFEFQTSFSGLAWAAHNANIAARAAYERCATPLRTGQASPARR